MASAGPSISDLRGKNVRSVEELEADIKQMVGIGVSDQRQQRRPVDEELQLHHQQQQLRSLQQHHHHQQQQQQQAKKMELSAFEKFVSLYLFGDEVLDLCSFEGC